MSRNESRETPEWEAYLRTAGCTQPEKYAERFACAIDPVIDPVDAGDKAVAIIVGKGTEWLKRKAYHRWPEVVKYISKQTKNIIILGKGDEDAEEARKIVALCPWVKNLVGRYTIPQTASILSRCVVAVGNDTGLMAVAKAVGTKRVIYFGPTSICKNKMPGDIVVSKRLDCSVDCQWSKGCEAMPCRDIEPDIIASATRTGKAFSLLMNFYNRYNFACSTMLSLLTAYDRHPVNLNAVLIDDASTDKRMIGLITQFKKALEARGCAITLIKRTTNNGRDKFGDTLKEGISALAKYGYNDLLYIQDDFLLNPDFFYAVEKAKALMVGKRKVCYFIFHAAKSGNFDPIDGNPEWGEMGTFHEWWPALWSADIVADFEISNNPCDTGTGTGRAIAAHMRKNGLIAFRPRNSLGIHLGETVSTLNSPSREQYPLYALDPILFDGPDYCRLDRYRKGV
jgi:hypothetical protein